MNKSKLKLHLTSEELKQKMKDAKDKREYRRWQAIYLLKTRVMNAKEVSELVGVCTHTVHQWVYNYNKKGPDSMKIKGQQGGNRALMTREEEKEFLIEIEKEVSSGSIITTKTIKEKVEKRLGRSVSKDYPYDLLHRNGWEKVSTTIYSERDKKVIKSLKVWQPIINNP